MFEQIVDLRLEGEITLDVFVEAVRFLINIVPAGCVSEDESGGVRIEWTNVHLVIPKERVAYIYYGIDCDNYGTENATPERLRYWLRRLIK